jgi:hypothetical protein
MNNKPKMKKKKKDHLVLEGIDSSQPPTFSAHRICLRILDKTTLFQGIYQPIIEPGKGSKTWPCVSNAEFLLLFAPELIPWPTHCEIYIATWGSFCPIRLPLPFPVTGIRSA